MINTRKTIKEKSNFLFNGYCIGALIIQLESSELSGTSFLVMERITISSVVQIFTFTSKVSDGGNINRKQT